VARRGRFFRTILCTTDFSAVANNAVVYARRLAKEAAASLVVMHAVEWPLGDDVTSGDVLELRKSMESSARARLVRLLPRSSADGPAAQAVVTIGRASAAILEQAHARSADLIVMGVSGLDAVDAALLGSTTHRVLREGTWPVLTVPDGALAPSR
jgi:universal stress protein A